MKNLLNSVLLGVASVLMFSATAKAAEIRIIANPGIAPVPGVQGHAIIAFYDDSGNLVETKAFWPSPEWRNPFKGSIRSNYSSDWQTGLFKNCSWSGCGERRARVSMNRLNWLRANIATESFTGCKNYSISGIRGCNCITFATNVWKKATEGQESFSSIDPLGLKASIVAQNGRTRSIYFNRGITWQ
jgi:hypothetical protein